MGEGTPWAARNARSFRAPIDLSPPPCGLPCAPVAATQVGMKSETLARVSSLLPWGGLVDRILLVMALAWLSFAPGAAGWTVSVAEFSLSVGAGETADATFTILNDEPVAARFRIALSEWDEDQDGVTVIRPAGSVERSCVSWILIGPPGEVFLGPFDEVQIRVSIAAPLGVHGTYWSGLLIACNPDGESTPVEGIAVAGELFVKIYVTVPPGETAAEVAFLEVGGFQPLWATVRVVNGGSVRLFGITGVLSMEDASGEEVSVPLPIVDVLPGHSIDVRIDTAWRAIEPGIYLVRAVVDFGAEYLIAGQIVVRVP
jgi:hypothetical protein